MNDGVLENPAITCAGESVVKRALGIREKVPQQLNQLRRQAFVEKEFHPREALLCAANSAA